MPGTAAGAAAVAALMVPDGWNTARVLALACNVAYTATLYAAACDDPPPPVPKALTAAAGA